MMKKIYNSPEVFVVDMGQVADGPGYGGPTYSHAQADSKQANSTDFSEGNFDSEEEQYDSNPFSVE